MKEFTKVLVSAQEIEKRITELGEQITKDYSGSNAPLLLIGILRGSVVFFSDLIRKINLPNVILDFMAISSYGSSHKTTGEVRLIKDLDESLEGKNVIIVEDIVDSGLTLQFLKKVLGSRNPLSLKVCCLLDKPERRKIDIASDYVGFNIPNEFVVGYGLDYNQKYRHLPHIAILDPSVYLD